MLILLPASEAKRAPAGPPFDVGSLSFPELTPTRVQVIDALANRDLELDGAPTAPVMSVYAGVLHTALGYADLDAASRRRADRRIVVISAVFGALRPPDLIPSYRVNMCSRLPGLGHLPQVWRGPLDAVLPPAAGRGIVVDMRSGDFVTAWRPTGIVAARTVVVKVVGAGARRPTSHGAKRTRGLVARRILSDALDPRDPGGLADGLSGHFDVDLVGSPRTASSVGRPSTLCVVEA